MEANIRLLTPAKPASAHNFLAALIAQIPVKGVPMVRYYGRYANKRRRRGARPETETSLPATKAARRPRRRTRWRQLIHHVWGADPLRCPHCDGFLCRERVVDKPADIRAILEPLGLYEGPVAPAQAPPGSGTPALDRSTWNDPPIRFESGIDGAGESASPTAFVAGPDPDLRQPAADPVIVLDAESGAVHAVGTRPATRVLSSLASKTDPWYHRQWYVAEDHDFDKAGFELPPEGGPDWSAAAQLTLFADADVQSFPPDDEPVYQPAAWANLARLRMPPRLKIPARSDDLFQADPPDDAPTLIYD